MDIDYASIWNFFLEYIVKIIILGIVVGVIGGLIVQKLGWGIKEKYFEFCKKIDDISPSDFGITEYRDFYYQQKEDDLIFEALNSHENIIITGKPKAGKTRAAYESLKKLDGFKVIKFWSNKPINLEEIPNWILKNKIVRKSKIIIFIDDLDKYIDKLDINQLTKKLNLTTKEFIIVATCRAGIEFNHVKKEFNESIRDFNEIKLEDIDNIVAKDLSEEYSLNYEDYDGTIGSLFLGIEDMKNRYHELSDEYHVLFQIIKLFNDANTFFIDKKVLKKVYIKKIEGDIFPTISFDSLIKNLEENSLIARKKENIKISHDCYLDFAEYNTSIDDFLWLRELLIEINYIEGLFNLGGAFFYKKLYDDTLICYNAALMTTEDYLLLNNKGIVLNLLNNYDDALKCFDKAINLNPDLERAYKGKGDVLRYMGRLEEAIKCYDKSLDVNSEYYLGFISKGNILADLKKFDKAINCFDKAIKIDPGNIAAFYNKGATLVEMKKLDDALTCFNDALKIDPNDFDSLLAKGKILMEKGEYNYAKTCFNETFQIDSENGLEEDEKDLYNKARALSFLNNQDEAIDYFNKIFDTNPNNEAVLMSRGNTLMKMEKYDDAINDYNKLIRNNPNNEEALLNRGVSLAALKKYDDAIVDYNKILELNPYNKKALFNKANSLFNKDQLDDALKCYKNVLKLNPIKNPDKNQVLSNINSALINKGASYSDDDLDKALKCFNEVLENDSENKSAWYNKANTLMKMNQKPEAIECYNQVLRLDPYFCGAYYYKGRLLEKLNEHDKAIHCFDKILEKHPECGIAWYSKAFSLESLEELNYALECYSKALKFQSDLYYAFFRQGIIFMQLNEHDKALNSFNKHLEKYPKHIESLCNKGFIYIELGQMSKALNYFEEALKIDESFEPALKAKKKILED